MSYQQLTIIGNVGNVQEVRTVGESQVLNFSVASNEKYGDTEKTTWFRVAVWGKLASSLAPWIVSGKQVMVVGSLQSEQPAGTPRVYEKDGNHYASYEVRADTIRLLGSKSDSEPKQEKTDLPF